MTTHLHIREYAYLSPEQLKLEEKRLLGKSLLADLQALDMRINGINFSPPYMRAERLEKLQIHRKEKLAEYLKAKKEFLAMAEAMKKR